MPKKFTKRELVMRNRSKKRNQKLKIHSPTKGKVTTLEEQNRAVLDRILAKIK